ncbi:ABC transporter ATP-binding protein [Candidatus Nitrosocosmicus agrestis]|uniref:ABC transporter ATP-binding protein n=1 Tax=Candidatus Nitrosocosmicus agrestis TaxID=2563600 RepID=UPI00122DF3F5|nr:ABC transporter ATP-binding protein [Candidatus Nitrosocosmicus sp. SS]KAA2280354.1 ABC transporter ATP-binding protein [Candidatus Nitrosocosmicus sp. SS]KAF0868030.1 ABC transporter ATP-binding protein [Candidatus Nitrosocosmicus sp. SS]
MVSLRIENLSKKYDKKTAALDNLNIKVESGEFMVFLGPSGCGKTTALRCIAGLISPTTGSIYLGDKKINDLSPKDRDIAMVFQNYALYPHMTVFDNMAFPLKMRKYSKTIIQEKVTKMAQVLGITDLLDRKPKELSGGQMQRVALGRALVREPKLFLMDEPLSNLDAKLRTHMRTEIKKLQKSIRITTLYITHDQVEAMSMADRIVIMKSGHIQQIGTPLEVYHKPRNTFVAQFIGNPQMNLMPCTFVTNDNQSTIISLHSSNIQIPISKSDISTKVLSEKFIIGVRPKDIVIIDNTENFEGIKLECTVTYVEILGDEITLEVAVGTADNLVISLKNNLNLFNQGNKLQIGFEYSKLHFFTSEGSRIE